MGEHSQKAFTADKLKKFAASGGPDGKHRDKDASAVADDYGRKAARSSDSSAFALGGAAKAPSLGRAGRAGGGRVNRAEGGPAEVEMPKKYSSGPTHEEELDTERAHRRGLAAIANETGQSYAPEKRGGRIHRARGGRAKSKGKTVVNVIVGGRGEQPQQPPQMPMPPPPPPRLPPPPPPQAATGPVGPPPGMPPGGPPGMPPGGPPMPPGGPPGMPPRGLPPGMMPPGRASGGRISEKYGSGSGLGRMEKTKRENSGKMKLAE